MFHYPWGLHLIQGELASKTGIKLKNNVRCPHGVVDGDKPFTAAGPRCLMCREEWYPVESSGRERRREASCPTCGESLHITYVGKYDKDTRKYPYVPQSWSHEAGALWCKRSSFPIRGHEQNYGFYGWGDWVEYSEFLIRQFHDGLEREMLYEERYNK